MTTFDLTGRVALVTGGNGGIGLGMAKGLSDAGARVMVAGRDADKNRRAVAALGGNADAIAVDMAEESGCRAAVDAAVRKFGRLDILVNNAGVRPEGPFENLSLDSWHQVLAVILDGPFL